MRKDHQRVPEEKKKEIISAYFTGDNSYEELGNYYGITPSTIRGWVCRFRKSKNSVSLQAYLKPSSDMANKKKDESHDSEISRLEARIRELELQKLALNTLIDVAERNGIDVRKKSGAKQ